MPYKQFITNWDLSQIVATILASVLGAGTYIFGLVEDPVQKYGILGFCMLLAGLLGKYWSYRPATLKAQAEARMVDAETGQKQITVVIEGLNDVHKQHVEILTGAITYHKQRADRLDKILAISRRTRHEILQETNRLGLQVQILESLLHTNNLTYTPYQSHDLAFIFREEDKQINELLASAI